MTCDRCDDETCAAPPTPIMPVMYNPREDSGRDVFMRCGFSIRVVGKSSATLEITDAATNVYIGKCGLTRGFDWLKSHGFAKPTYELETTYDVLKASNGQSPWGTRRKRS